MKFSNVITYTYIAKVKRNTSINLNPMTSLMLNRSEMESDLTRR